MKMIIYIPHRFLLTHIKTPYTDEEIYLTETTAKNWLLAKDNKLYIKKHRMMILKTCALLKTPSPLHTKITLIPTEHFGKMLGTDK